MKNLREMGDTSAHQIIEALHRAGYASFHPLKQVEGEVDRLEEQRAGAMPLNPGLCAGSCCWSLLSVGSCMGGIGRQEQRWDHGHQAVGASGDGRRGYLHRLLIPGKGAQEKEGVETAWIETRSSNEKKTEAGVGPES